MAVRSLALLITLAACSDSSSKAPVDAGTTPDGGGNTASVVTVTCPATVPLTVDAPDADARFTFTPPTATTIAVNDIVKFTMHSSHNVVPNPSTATDAGLKVNFGETKCLQFTRAGSYGFMCQPHGFTGKITVQ